jgi:DNA-binding NtrC family response regulator
MSKTPFPHVGRRGTVPNEVGIFNSDGHVRPLEEIERDVIRLALIESGGSVTRAACGLRIGRSTLYRKMDWTSKGERRG